MDDRNNGLLIEGLVQGSYDRMFGPGKVEARHHPLTSWAQATVSLRDPLPRTALGWWSR